MARRPLSSDEQALWDALARTVRPLRPGARPQALPVSPIKAKPVAAPAPAPFIPPVTIPVRTPTATLDSTWEKRIRGGNLTPDFSIDLHGHTLSAAHARLNQSIAAAWAQGARTLLIVTGRPPKVRGIGNAESRRGAIRGEIGHWLESGPHADHIASVRVAHPRHGGDGALYVILRRKK
jgi:DNA-nicking Smr family endonuclease